MSDARELKAIAEYLAGCGNLRDADFIISIVDRIKELEAKQVPEGWQLVPVEPTHAMGLAGNAILPSRIDCISVWDAMLAAAPEVKP